MNPQWWWLLGAAFALVLMLKVVWSGIKMMLKLALLAAITVIAAVAYFGVGGI